MKAKLTLPIFKIVSDCSEEIGVQAFVIGGWVRDLMLNRPCKDIDFVCVASSAEASANAGVGIKLAECVAKKLGPDVHVTVYKNFGTANIKLEDLEIEFVGARRESYDRGSRKPVVEDGTLEDDQNRRDFTINAMAISLSKNNYGELIDPFN